MAIQRIIRFICDHPECANKNEGSEKDLVQTPEGFVGTVVVVGWGARIKWYACRSAHIEKAVLGAIDRTLSEHQS